MFKRTSLVTLVPEIDSAARERVLAVLRAVPSQNALLQPTLPGVYNGGDYIWHRQYADENAARTAENSNEGRAAAMMLADRTVAANVETAAYVGGGKGAQPNHEKPGVYRTLFFSVRPGTPASTLATFEREMLAMPTHVRTIKAWQLSRVSAHAGTRPWSHVWEQEFEKLDALLGPYMMHPYHWSFIDRRFDPDCSDWIVDTFLCHTFCALDRRLI
jgi:hypothetical protein